jgi:hypothetical protein
MNKFPVGCLVRYKRDAFSWYVGLVVSRSFVEGRGFAHILWFNTDTVEKFPLWKECLQWSFYSMSKDLEEISCRFNKE